MILIHESDSTRVLLQSNVVYKHFLGEQAQERFEKEVAFYKLYSSHHLPHFVSYDSEDEYVIATSFLRGEAPGFLDASEGSLLSFEDFQKIKEALLSIQMLPSYNFLIHGDLAPHNIYLTDRRVVVADWDSYWYTKNRKYRMYDYASLWAWLDTNHDYLAKLFRDKEKSALAKHGLLDDFEFCFRKRVDFMNKYPPHLRGSGKLRGEIMNTF